MNTSDKPNINNKKTINILTVGDDYIGKSNLFHVYQSHKFPYDHRITYQNYKVENVFIEIDNKITLDKEDSNKNNNKNTISKHCVDLIFWDVENARLRPLYYKDMDIFLVCFSFSSIWSFDNIRTRWIPELDHFHPEAPILLVGTQSDKREKKEDIKQPQTYISHQKAIELMHEINAFDYMECSSSTSSESVKAVFNRAIAEVISGRKRKQKNKSICTLL